MSVICPLNESVQLCFGTNGCLLGSGCLLPDATLRYVHLMNLCGYVFKLVQIGAYPGVGACPDTIVCLLNESMQLYLGTNECYMKKIIIVLIL